MKLPRVFVGLVGALAITAVSACSDAEGGSAVPNGPTTPTGQAPSAPGSTPSGGSDAPTVPNPVDVSALESDPCSALSSAQVERLNLQSGKKDSVGTGPLCEYEYDDDSASRVSIIQTPDFTNGLTDVYARKDSLAYFEPTEISGYPAVYASRSDGRANGICQLHVGLTDSFVATLYVQLTHSTPDYPRGCEVAELTAQTMIENLKGGS